MNLFEESLDESEQLEIRRKHLENLVTSYSDEADVFTELIQNAIDAIELRSDEEGFEGELVVVVGRRSNSSHYVYVQDNGVGMASGLLGKIFRPGYSFGKQKGKTVGYKGVGSSYLLAVSTHLAVATVDESGTRSEMTVRHAFDWVTDEDDVAQVPVGEPQFEAPSFVKALAEEIERGTGVYFAFHPGHKPSSLSNTVLVGPDIDAEVTHWAYYLSGRSAIGLAIPDGADVPQCPISVRVVLDRGGETAERVFSRTKFHRDSASIGYPFPQRVLGVATDTKVIESTPAHQVHTHNRRHQAVYKFWSAEEFVDLLGDRLDDEEKAGLNSHLQWVCGYLAYSSEVLAKVNEIAGTRSQVVRWGARICVDGAPQGRPLDLKLTSDQGLDRQTHIVLGFTGLELDTGRKFISDEKILSGVDKINQRVVSYLKDFRWAMKKKDRAEISSKLDEWRASIAQRTGNSRIPQLFAAYSKEVALDVDPDNEQEVIALWMSFLAGGLLKGYSTRAISGFNRYDSLVDIRVEAVAADLNDSLAPTSEYTSAKASAVLEFKHDFGSLIQDFEEKVKYPAEIDLVVAWDCAELNLSRGSIQPVYGKWRDKRPVYGCSYVWEDEGQPNEIHVICLKNLVAELLNAKGEAIGRTALDELEQRDEAKSI